MSKSAEEKEICDMLAAELNTIMERLREMCLLPIDKQTAFDLGRAHAALREAALRLEAS